MSYIKHYIEKSILIPPGVKESISTDEVHSAIEEDMLCFMETYTPMEREVLEQVNKELETLNIQMRSYLKNKEAELRKEEMAQIEFELAYI